MNDFPVCRAKAEVLGLFGQDDVVQLLAPPRRLQKQFVYRDIGEVSVDSSSETSSPVFTPNIS
jgi:hypothetical protein